MEHSYLNVAGTKPLAASLEKGEIVINEADGTLWSKRETGSVFQVGGSVSSGGGGGTSVVLKGSDLPDVGAGTDGDKYLRTPAMSPSPDLIEGVMLFENDAGEVKVNSVISGSYMNRATYISISWDEFKLYMAKNNPHPVGSMVVLGDITLPASLGVYSSTKGEWVFSCDLPADTDGLVRTAYDRMVADPAKATGYRFAFAAEVAMTEYKEYFKINSSWLPLDTRQDIPSRLARCDVSMLTAATPVDITAVVLGTVTAADFLPGTYSVGFDVTWTQDRTADSSVLEVTIDGGTSWSTLYMAAAPVTGASTYSHSCLLELSAKGTINASMRMKKSATSAQVLSVTHGSVSVRCIK